MRGLQRVKKLENRVSINKLAKIVYYNGSINDLTNSKAINREEYVVYLPNKNKGN